MTPEQRRTDLARRALAANGPRIQRLACAGELFELSEVLASLSRLGAQLLRDSLGRHDERALAEEVVGAEQTIAAVRLTLDPEVLAAAELAQADKLEAKLELAEAEGVAEESSCPGCEPHAVTDTAPALARMLWERLTPAQQAAMRQAGTTSDGARAADWMLHAGSVRALVRAELIEPRTQLLTKAGLAVRAAGMGR